MISFLFCLICVFSDIIKHNWILLSSYQPQHDFFCLQRIMFAVAVMVSIPVPLTSSLIWENSVDVLLDQSVVKQIWSFYIDTFLWFACSSLHLVILRHWLNLYLVSKSYFELFCFFFFFECVCFLYICYCCSLENGGLQNCIKHSHANAYLYFGSTFILHFIPPYLIYHFYHAVCFFN